MSSFKGTRTIESFQIDPSYNNVFTSHPQLIKTVFDDVIELKPPS